MSQVWNFPLQGEQMVIAEQQPNWLKLCQLQELLMLFLTVPHGKQDSLSPSPPHSPHNLFNIWEQSCMWPPQIRANHDPRTQHCNRSLNAPPMTLFWCLSAAVLVYSLGDAPNSMGTPSLCPAPSMPRCLRTPGQRLIDVPRWLRGSFPIP